MSKILSFLKTFEREEHSLALFIDIPHSRTDIISIREENGKLKLHLEQAAEGGEFRDFNRVHDCRHPGVVEVDLCENGERVEEGTLDETFARDKHCLHI